MNQFDQILDLSEILNHSRHIRESADKRLIQQIPKAADALLLGLQSVGFSQSQLKAAVQERFNNTQLFQDLSIEAKDHPDPILLNPYALFEIQIALIRSFTSQANSSSVAFFWPSKGYGTMFNQLPALLQSRPDISVIYLYGFGDDPRLSEHESAFFAGFGMIQELGFIDVFFTPTIMDCLPAKSTKVLVPHTIRGNIKEGKTPDEQVSSDSGSTDSVSENYSDFTRMYSLFDYVTIATAEQLDSHDKLHQFYGRSINGSTDRSAHPDSELILKSYGAGQTANTHCIIPAGYMSLDSLSSYSAENKTDEARIIYAPTLSIEAWKEFTSIEPCGGEIMLSLLRAFPNHKIIFRPHPHEKETVIQPILDKVTKYPNFEYDDCKHSYIQQYSRSQLMVSDLSSTAYTYPLATLNPIVFYSWNEEELLKFDEGNQNGYLADRSKVGAIAENCDQLITKIESLLSEKHIWSKKIRAYKKQLIFNPDNADNYLAQHIDHIIQGTPCDEWNYYSRKKAAVRIPQTEPKLSKQLQTF